MWSFRRAALRLSVCPPVATAEPVNVFYERSNCKYAELWKLLRAVLIWWGFLTTTSRDVGIISLSIYQRDWIFYRNLVYRKSAGSLRRRPEYDVFCLANTLRVYSTHTHTHTRTHTHTQTNKHTHTHTYTHTHTHSLTHSFTHTNIIKLLQPYHLPEVFQFIWEM